MSDSLKKTADETSTASAKPDAKGEKVAFYIAPPGQRKYITNMVFDGDPLTNQNIEYGEHWLVFERDESIKDEELKLIPKHFWLESMARPPFLIDFNRDDGCANLVTGRFKDVVEAMEPGVHDFIPVTATWVEQDEPIDEDLYFLHVRQSVSDMTDTENCGWYWGESEYGDGTKYKIFTNSGSEDGTRALFMDKIEGFHLYRGGDGPHPPHDRIVSPELMKALKAAKLTRMEFTGELCASPRRSAD